MDRRVSRIPVRAAWWRTPTYYGRLELELELVSQYEQDFAPATTPACNFTPSLLRTLHGPVHLLPPGVAFF